MVGLFYKNYPFRVIFFCIYIAIIYINKACIIVRKIYCIHILYEVGTMNTIIRRIIIYILLICFLTAASAILFVFPGEGFSNQARLISIFIIAALAILIRFLIIDISNLKIAKLITENFILKVKTAVISEISNEECTHKHIEATEIFVSYFGILFNGKIEKFNQDGVRLTAMYIGDDFMSFTYGNEKQMQNIRIVCPNIEPEAMESMINKFRFETGITPTMIGG